MAAPVPMIMYNNYLEVRNVARKWISNRMSISCSSYPAHVLWQRLSNDTPHSDASHNEEKGNNKVDVTVATSEYNRHWSIITIPLWTSMESTIRLFVKLLEVVQLYLHWQAILWKEGENMSIFYADLPLSLIKDTHVLFETISDPPFGVFSKIIISELRSCIN